MRCRLFQIDGFEARLWKMLLLVFSQNKSLYSAVEDAFITINLMKNPTETVVSLLNHDIESSISDLAALEFIVGSLASKGDISTITEILGRRRSGRAWSRVEFEDPNVADFPFLLLLSYVCPFRPYESL